MRDLPEVVIREKSTVVVMVTDILDFNMLGYGILV